MATDLPTITVVVVNHNGRKHLSECFSSLRELDYPAERLELMLVDNASTDGSVEYMRRELPGVRVVEAPTNLGFGGGNNLGAEEANGDYLLFLNNDMRADPKLVKGLLAAISSGPGIVCAGAKILNWDGSEIDFAGAGLHFAGYASQEGYGSPAFPNKYPLIKPILFACGGAMMILRDTFRAAGGFDADYFAYYEDSDLGWRLWLMGHEIVFAPKAMVYHRHHGTTGSLSASDQQALYKRNALFSVIKNYSDEYVFRVLSAALLGLTHAQAVRAEDESTLTAIKEVVEDLPNLMRKREFVQSKRRRSDREVAEFFQNPFRFWPGVDQKTQFSLVTAFGIHELFGHLPRRVLVISSDILPYPGLPTVGSGLRAWALGQGLKARGHEIIFSMPRAAVEGREDQLPSEVVEMAWEPEKFGEVIEAAEPDVVVACNWPILALLPDDVAGMPTVLDQHGPHLLEREYQDVLTPEENAEWKLRALTKADFFTCAGEVQLRYFDDWLERAGWTERERAELARAIPVSMSPNLPEHVVGDGPVFVYGGVFLPWQDPSVALSCLVEVLERHQSGELHVFGGRHPVYEVNTGVMDSLLTELGQSPRVKSFGMVPHEELISSYTRAQVAVDAVARNRERELAFTTRTVEYLWCGLPVIYNDYSELSDYIREYQAGWTVDPQDERAMTAVYEQILEDPQIVEERSHNAQRLVREKLSWSRTIEPLDAFVRHPRWRSRPVPPPPPPPGQKLSLRTRLRNNYRAGGVGQVARKGLVALQRRVRERGR
jgi:GT2 family glycosyltransferase